MDGRPSDPRSPRCGIYTTCINSVVFYTSRGEALRISARANDLIAIGKAVRAARMERGISQERLSLDAGVDRAFVSELKRGKRNVTFGNLLKVCRTLDVRPSGLFVLWESRFGGS